MGRLTAHFVHFINGRLDRKGSKLKRMILNRRESHYGRLIKKPNENENEDWEEVVVEISYEEQIEMLRAKIALKKKYNETVKEEMAEANMDAHSQISRLWNESLELRGLLRASLRSERDAVQNALRTHRDFQLAMTYVPYFAIPWLEDKVFDMTKRLNNLLYRLNEKRKQIEECEQAVNLFEKWPVPGSTPWEKKALCDYDQIEQNIELVKSKFETASIISAKYTVIINILGEERRKYDITLIQFRKQYCTLLSELEVLEKHNMDANYFKRESWKNLKMTEAEAAENQRKRKKQFETMKRGVQKILEENHRRQSNLQKENAKMEDHSRYNTQEGSRHTLISADKLQMKRNQLEDFEKKEARLIQAMHAKTIVDVPKRLKIMQTLTVRLGEEQETKTMLRDNFLKKRDQLGYVLFHFRYTGAKEEEIFEKRELEYKEASIVANDELKAISALQQNYGDIFVKSRLILFSICTNFDDDKGEKSELRNEPNIVSQMEGVLTLLEWLVSDVNHLKNHFGEKEPKRDYSIYLQPSPVLARRYTRVTILPEDDEDALDDDIKDFKVPDRNDIKKENSYYAQQAKLKRGISTDRNQ